MQVPGTEVLYQTVQERIDRMPGESQGLKTARERQRFKVCTGTHYHGVYIGYDASKCVWLRERTLTW